VIALYTRETTVTAQFKHPNIVKFYGICVQPPTIFLVFELAKGNLRQLLKRRDQLDWSPSLMLRLALDVTKPIAYLHKMGYIHRDIKSLNYLVMEDYTIKLTDFGLSRVLESELGIEDIKEDEDEGISNAKDMTRKVGTRWWMSPEMMDGKVYSEKADVYSLTMVLWEILTASIPFSEQKRAQLHNTVVVQESRPPIPDSCMPAYRELLEAGWATDPAERPTAAQIVEILEQMQANIPTDDNAQTNTPFTSI
jgi:serine/threonine protein kinase